MMSCWEVVGGGGGSHWDANVPLIVEGDSWRGTEDGVMSPLIWTTERERLRGGGGSYSSRSMPPGCGRLYMPACLYVCVCVCVRLCVCESTPLTDELKRPTESHTEAGWMAGGGWARIDEAVNCSNSSDVTAQLPLTTTARQVLCVSVHLVNISGIPLPFISQLPTSICFAGTAPRKEQNLIQTSSAQHAPAFHVC